MVYLEKDIWRGGLIFVAFTAGVNVLMFPGAVLSLTAGAIFGLYAGSALAVTGTILGQTLTFCVGRCAPATPCLILFFATYISQGAAPRKVTVACPSADVV